jgi:hypothetical protein
MGVPVTSSGDLSKTTVEKIRKQFEGHIYVIEFGSGTVKVGKTANPKNRLSQHEGAARMMGTEVISSWFSSRHRGWSENEDHLISFCLKRYGDPVVGRETFRAPASEVIRFAQSLPCSPMPIDEVAGYVARVAQLESGRSSFRADMHLNSLTRQVRLLINLTNDGNRAEANEALYNVLLQVAKCTQPKWALTDPDASLRYLERVSSDPRRMAQRAAEFEVSGRVLFLMSYGRWPDSFEELVSYFKVMADGVPTGVLICKNCDTDWGVQESDDGSCLNCGLGVVDPTDAPAGVVYEAPRFAGGAA